jgi:hypothetical protein
MPHIAALRGFDSVTRASAVGEDLGVSTFAMAKRALVHSVVDTSSQPSRPMIRLLNSMREHPDLG